MTSLAVAGIIGLVAATFLSRQLETTEELKATMVMHGIAKSIETAIARPEIIRASALYSTNAYVSRSTDKKLQNNGNQDLLNCIRKPTAENQPTCTSTDPGNPVSFDLIRPIGNDLTANAIAKLTYDAITKNTLAGGEFPLLYSLDGFKDCFLGGAKLDQEEKIKQIASRIPLDPFCQFAVTTSFWATCPADNLDALLPPTKIGSITPCERGYDGFSFCGSSTPGVTSGTFTSDSALFGPFIPKRAPKCPIADSINIIYQIRHVPSLGHINKFSKTLAPIPANQAFNANPGFGAISVAVSAIGAITDKELACPPNQSISSILNGQAICQCLPPFHYDPPDSNNCVIAEAKLCGATERYRGLNEKGNVICKPVSCEYMSMNDGCRMGGWIEQLISYYDHPYSPLTSGCRVSNCWVGKYGGECNAQVVCEGFIRCCYEIDTSLVPAWQFKYEAENEAQDGGAAPVQPPVDSALPFSSFLPTGTPLHPVPLTPLSPLSPDNPANEYMPTFP